MSWKLNSSQLNHYLVKEHKEIEIKDILELDENESTMHIPKLMGQNENTAKRNVHSTNCLHKIFGELSHDQLNAHLKL